MAGAGAVEGFAGPPGVQPDEVDRGGGVVFEAGFGQAEVAGAANAGDVGGLADGALDAGADLVALFPLAGGLFGAGVLDGFVEGRGCRDRRRPLREVGAHWGLAGQAWQVAAGNLTAILGVPCWVAACQLRAVAPWGQVTCWWSQSMANASSV